MADEEKIVNVIIKYSQQGAEAAAATSKKVRQGLTDDFIGSFSQNQKKLKGELTSAGGFIDSFMLEAQDRQKGFAKTMEATVKSTVEATQQMATGPIRVSQEQFDYYNKKTPDWEGFAETHDWAGKVIPETEKAKQKLDAYKKSMQELYGEMRGLRYLAMGMRELGLIFTVAGGAIMGGITASALSYVKTVGMINTESAQWLETQGRIRESTLSIGQSFTSALLPSMEKAADLMQVVAGIIQANPWMAQAALSVGVAMTGVGMALSLTSRLTTVVADIGLAISRLSVAGGASGEVGFIGGALAKLGITSSASLGPVLGVAAAIATVGASALWMIGIVDRLKERLQDKGADAGVAEGVGLMFGQIFSVINPLYIPLVNLRNAFGQLKDTLPELLEKFPWLKTALQDLAFVMAGIKGPESGMGPTITQDMVKAFIDYQEQIAAATRQYEAQRMSIITDTENQILEVTRQYEQQRAEAIADFERNTARQARDFNQQLSRMDRDFQQSQAKAFREYNESVAKSEREFRRSQQEAARNHQRELAKLDAEHTLRMRDLAAARDALGLVKEQEAYEIRKGLMEQDYQEKRAEQRQQHQQEMQDLRADFLQRQADARAAYEQQRADAIAAYEQRRADQLADFQLQLARMDAQHKLVMQKIDAQEKEKLAKLKQAYDEQMQTIETAFIGRLRALDAAIIGDLGAFQRHLQSQATAFQRWLDAYKATHNTVGSGTGLPGSGPGPHQAGGYARFLGAGEDGNPEFVMSNATTKLAESLLGGSLSQASLIAGLLGGKASAPGRTANITVVGRSLSVTEIRRTVADVMDERLADLIPAFGT